MTTIIRNGLLYDGTLSKGRKADIIIQNGNIQFVDDRAPEIEGARTIDATGKWITPGFLDIHTHYDAEIEVMPGLEESVRHGTTTVVMGNCSISAALGKDEDIIDLFARVENMPAQLLTDWIKDKITWKSLSEYYDHLEKLPMGPNVASFVGHSNIRIAAMGLDRSFNEPHATEEEKKKMQRYLEEAMEAGYLGMSIDMLPFHRWAGIFKPEYKGASVPSQQASVGEYRKLAKVLRKYDRVLQATPNALDKKSGLYLTMMSSGWFRKPLKTTVVAAMDLKSDESIYKLITRGSAFANTILRADMRFQALAFPFLQYGEGPITPLFEEFPSMVKMIGADHAERVASFSDPKFRQWFRDDWNSSHTSVFPKLLHEMTVTKSPDATLVGKTYQQLADKAGVDGLEHFMDIMQQYDTDIQWECTAANHREQQRIELLANDHTIPGFNDSGAHNVNLAYHDGALQTLKSALDRPDILSIEKAVHRLTKMPADWLGIDTGTIAVGRQADICIIDPERLETGVKTKPQEDYHPSLEGAFRFVKRTDGVVNHVFIRGEEAFSSEAGFNKDLGNKPFGRLLRSQF